MELLNDEIKKSKNFKKMCEFLKLSYEENRQIMSFSMFKELMKDFIEEIMNCYLSLYKIEEKCIFESNCILKSYASFSEEDNKVIISQDVLAAIYSGNLVYLITVFHELNHFKFKYDIKNGVIDEDLTCILKERLLRETFYLCSEDELSEDVLIEKDFYYEYNYEKYSEELVANINMIDNVYEIFRLSNISMNSYDMEKLMIIREENTALLRNPYRNFKFLYTSEYKDYNQVFEICIKYNKEWLKFPQIAAQYYVDENNKVLKKRKIII